MELQPQQEGRALALSPAGRIVRIDRIVRIGRAHAGVRTRALGEIFRGRAVAMAAVSA